MDKDVLLIVIISLLCYTCVSTQECNRTLVGSILTFTCPSNITNQELSLYDYTTAQLDSITSIVVNSINAASTGPFTSIPSNICLLRNLQSIAFSNNRIVQVDPNGALIDCSSNVITLDLSSNLISNFPSVMIYNMPNLQNLYFQNNQLTDVPSNAFVNVSTLEVINFSNNKLTSFELWILDVQNSVDFSYNQISMITNNYFYKISQISTTASIKLTNNNGPINLTDAIYEMYDDCAELVHLFNDSAAITTPAILTRSVELIDFGTTQLTCSCDQNYLLQMLTFVLGGIGSITNIPLLNASCTDGTLFQRYNCSNVANPGDSTVNFSQVYPRQCKIDNDESGDLTVSPNISNPMANASGYPHYKVEFMNPGACLFTFLDYTTMTIKCTNETSNSLSTIPSDLLTNSYLSNITRVTFPSLISSLPSYLCSLPSHEIDLSFQAFTTLSDATFPCLDWFYEVTLSSNNISSVNMASGNFTNLTSLDLSSNLLTMLPYSILNPTPTSLRYLDLRNNSIAYIDLFLYTLKNITIYLDGNPINSSDIRNPQNVTLSTGSVNGTNQTVNISFPGNVINSTIIIQDSIAVTYGLCNNLQTLRASLLNLRSIATNVLLDCTCASVNLKQLYSNNGLNITNDFPCSIATQTASFYTLNTTSCPNAISFTTGLCSNSTSQSNATTTIASSLQSGGGSTGSKASNTGLIIGLVVGLVGLAALIAGLIAAILIYKSKTAAAAKKPVGRATIIGRGPESSLQSKIQPRNLRSVRLTPLSSQPSRLPTVPVAAVLPTTTSFNRSDLRTSAKGIPLQLDPIRSPTNVNPQYPPNSNGPNNSSSFRPIDNMSKYQLPTTQQKYQEPKPQKPRTHQMLNAGGDTRY